MGSSTLAQKIWNICHTLRGGKNALFEIDDARTATVLAARHQREDDYH